MQAFRDFDFDNNLDYKAYLRIVELPATGGQAALIKVQARWYKRNVVGSQQNPSASHLIKTDLQYIYISASGQDPTFEVEMVQQTPPQASSRSRSAPPPASPPLHKGMATAREQGKKMLLLYMLVRIKSAYLFSLLSLQSSSPQCRWPLLPFHTSFPSFQWPIVLFKVLCEANKRNDCDCSCLIHAFRQKWFAGGSIAWHFLLMGTSSFSGRDGQK
jgi:hypothetical protein